MKRIVLTALLACVGGVALAGVVDIFNGVKLGSTLPPTAFEFLDGSPQAHPEVRLTLIDFWATWCAPCRESIPRFNELYDKYSAQGLAIVGVSDEEPDVVREFLKKTTMTYPSAVDGQPNLHKGLGIQALPYAVFVDSRKVIVWRGQPKRINEKLVQELLRKHG